MSKVARTVLWLPLFFVSTYAVSLEELHPDVSAFLQLLVRADEPTLAEYKKFSGECGSGESELVFEHNECRLKGWGINSERCDDFIRKRHGAAEQVPALELSWLRKRFSTVGKNYRVISVQPKFDGFDYELVEVEIGKNIFLLYHSTSPSSPGGLVVGVSKVNGKNVQDYLENE